MKYKSIKDIPQIGFGLWKVPKDVCSETVYNAIEAGYRHLDSASDYGNEKEVGEGIKASLDHGLCK
ncbi:MAG: aldo/keto reductase, partial [Gammaproteobacteria bacterium]